MLGWMSYNVESRLPGKISKTSDTQMIPFYWQKAKEFQTNIYFCFTDNTKVFDCVDHNKLWKNLKEMEYHTTLPAS